MLHSTIFVFLIYYFTSSFAGEVAYSDCTDLDPKGWCKINKIEFVPHEVGGGSTTTARPRRLDKGKTFITKIYFTALQPIRTMKSSPFHAKETGDVPFHGMQNKDNACEFTQCPVAQNVDQIYNFQLKITASLPRGVVPVKWKFWVNDDLEKGCCASLTLIMR